jgi:hypothetical protein
MAAFRRRPALAALVASVALLGSGAIAEAQPAPDAPAPDAPAPGRGAVRRLSGTDAPAVTELTFDLLLGRHIRYQVGGLERLPAAASQQPVVPSVFVTVTPTEVLLFDHALVRLARGLAASAETAACLAFGARPESGRPVRCLPRLRTRAVASIAEEAERLRRREVAEPPTVLFLTDKTVPFSTFSQAAYSLALATDGAPPRLTLAVRSSGKVMAVPFLLVPPRPVTIAPGASPMLPTVHLSRQHILVETSSYYSSGRPTSVASLQALEELAGQLKSRNPDCAVAFLLPDESTTMDEVASALARLHLFFPSVVVGQHAPTWWRRGAR